MTINSIKTVLTLSLLTIITACGGAKQQAMLDTINSPQARPATFEAIGEDLQMAERERVNLISPEEFLQAKKSYENAVVLRNEGQSSDKYNEKLSDSRKDLDSAIAFTKANKDRMAPLVEAREAALSSGAAETTNKDLASLEKNYLRLVTDLGLRNSRPKALDRIPELTGEYKKLTVKTVQAKHLGEAKNNLELAKSENADSLVPKTLKETEESIQKTNEFIAQNQDASNLATIIQMGEASTAASRRLLALTRETKISKELSPEDLALKAEAKLNTAGEESSRLQQNLKGSQSEVAALQDQTKKLAQLEKKDEKNKKFETVRELFNEAEAKVYRQGNSLIISLKKVNFPVNGSAIPSPSFEVLKKVQTAIKSFNEPSIVVEGHTDSTGETSLNKALSEKRAEAVKAYFLSNSVMTADKIEAVGYGSEKPLASNASTEGRAINRRIDIVIQN